MKELTQEQISTLKEILYDFLDENDHREDVRDILITLQIKNNNLTKQIRIVIDNNNEYK